MFNQQTKLRKKELLIQASLIAKHNQVLTHQIPSLKLRNQLEIIQYIQHCSPVSCALNEPIIIIETYIC